MLSKYTILNNKTKLEKKMGNKIKKAKRTRIPPRGMGSGLERDYSKWFFIIKGYNISKIVFTLVLVIWDPKAYNKLTSSLKKNTAVGEASGKLWFAQELENGQSLLLFFVKPAKKNQAIKIKCAQKHFKSVLDHHASYRKQSK